MTVQLRQWTMENVVNDTNVFDCPVEWSGSFNDMWDWASNGGYVWKKSQNVFGGHFYNPNTMACLIPT